MSKISSQPKGLRIKLFTHQLQNIARMERLERKNKLIFYDVNKETKLGLLTDKTGYGKSFCIIGLICRDKMSWDIDIPYVINEPFTGHNNLVSIYEEKRYRKINTNLIIVSGNILKQWEEYLAYSNLKYFSIRKSSEVESLEVEDYDVILCPVKSYNLLVSTNSGIAWKRFIYDEPGHTKITKMKNIQAGFYWFVTATPKEILNQYRTAKSGFIKDNFINNTFTTSDYEDMISGICIDNNEEDLKKSFILPENIDIYYECHNPIYKVVSGLVSAKIEALIEAGNIREAISKLCGKRTSNLIELIKQRKIEELEELYIKLSSFTDTEVDKIDKDKEYKKLLSQRDRLETQLKEIDVRYKDFLNQSCSICLGKLNEPVLETNCQNLFCGECLINWLKHKSTCPLCITGIDKDSLVYIKEGIEDYVCNIRFSVKMTKDNQVLDIIEKTKDGKFILFSEFDSFGNVIDTLKDKKIKFFTPKGALTSIEKNITKFKDIDSETNIIILNSKYNGAGLNLQETTDIILYHTVSADTYKQIIGRANRIGRKKLLRIHHLKV